MARTLSEIHVGSIVQIGSWPEDTFRIESLSEQRRQGDRQLVEYLGVRLENDKITASGTMFDDGMGTVYAANRGRVRKVE